MSEFQATITWTASDAPFEPKTYTRDHLWRFPCGESLPGTSAPVYGGSVERVNPEEGFVAILAACHMLTFLAVASRRGFVVASYEDTPAGTLDRNADGRMAMTRVRLRPRVTFSGNAPDDEQLADLHARAHRGCFIANSVRSEVVIES